MDKYLKEIVQGEPLYKNAHYEVLVVKMPDMPTSTYAVVNSETGIMEQLHPTLFGVKRLADMFADAHAGKSDPSEQFEMLDGLDVAH